MTDDKRLTFHEYQEKARKTAIYPGRYTVIYPALGIAGEAGEINERVKKAIRDNDGKFDELVKLELIKEIGDVLWYCAALAWDLGIDLGAIATLNLNKLADRARRGVIGGDGDER